MGLITAAGMFLVLVAGVTVTATGSEYGCGSDWPLCQGRFIPEFTLSTAIEYSHRVITAGETALVLLLAAGLIWLEGRRWSARILAALLVASLFLQAGMGALAVLYPQQAVVLAIHFGISLIAVSTALLAGLAARWPNSMLSAPPSPPLVTLAIWSLAIYIYILIYSGALVSHLGAGYACPGWPPCHAQGAPIQFIQINLFHRGLAGLALIFSCGLIFFLRWKSSPRSDLIRGAEVLTIALVLQALTGGFLVLSHWSLSGELLHASVTAAVFASAAYLCLRTSLRSPSSYPGQIQFRS